MRLRYVREYPEGAVPEDVYTLSDLLIYITRDKAEYGDQFSYRLFTEDGRAVSTLDLRLVEHRN